MINKIIHKGFLILFILSKPNFIFAQQDQIATALQGNNKTNVVVIVLSVILLGIVLKLIMTDRKLTSLEKKINNEN